jgi:xanthine dehydrogenase accessory factor
LGGIEAPVSEGHLENECCDFLYLHDEYYTDMTSHENVLKEAKAQICDGETVVLATIVDVTGSSSHPVGSRMAVFPDGTFLGSVSGGCVEGDVAYRAGEVRQDGLPRIVEYHQVKDPVFEVGLNCDGSILVLLEAATEALVDSLRTTTPGLIVTRVMRLSRGLQGGPVVVEREVRRGGTPPKGRAASRRVGEELLLEEPVGFRNKLLIFGAGDIAAVLSAFAARVGFDVTVSDPRSSFADANRHPDANRVIAAWPREVLAQVGVDDASYIVSLNHEPRFEDALFVALMEHPRPAYIGAIGKPERQTEREARQRESGFDLSRLPRVHTPIGLPIGGKSPEEIAVSILAQLIALRNGRG